MDQFPQMLFRAGGTEPMHGGNFFTRIVRGEEELAEALAAGWFESTTAATAGNEAAAQVAPTAASETPADDAPPTREEMEQQAAKLGIKVDGRWSDQRLMREIAEKG